MIDYIMLAPSPVPRQLVTKPLFARFPVWGGGDVNVPVHLLTSCMLRELRGCQGYIILYIHNITQGKSHLDTYIYMYLNMCIHIDLFSLLYTVHTTVHIFLFIFMHINILLIYLHIYISYVYI